MFSEVPSTPRSPHASHRVLAALIGAALAMLAQPALESAPRASASASGSYASSGTCDDPTAVAAKLRIRVRSTAPHAAIHLQPGFVTGRTDQQLAGGATTSYVLDGVAVDVPLGRTGEVVTDVVVVEAQRSQSITLAIDKAPTGRVTVSVDTLTDSEPWVRLDVGQGETTAATTVRRRALYDHAWELPKADDRKLVLATYYPWWTARDWDERPVAETPLHPRSVWNSDGVLSMTKQARAAGVDGFVVSWMGELKNGRAYRLAHNAAWATGGVVAPYLEVSEGLTRGGVARVEQWLREAVARTGPASLTVDGVPVVFVWDMAKIGAHDWAAMVADLDRPVLLVGDADTNTHGSVMRGWHQYLPSVDLAGQAMRSALLSGWFRGQAALEGRTPRLHVATVSPGFDDRALRGWDRPVIARGDGRYGDTWQVALAGDPDMVLITSWNEWYEGTEIEPGTRWGRTALEATERKTEAWKASTATCSEA